MMKGRFWPRVWLRWRTPFESWNGVMPMWLKVDTYVIDQGDFLQPPDEWAACGEAPNGTIWWEWHHSVGLRDMQWILTYWYVDQDGEPQQQWQMQLYINNVRRYACQQAHYSIRTWPNSDQVIGTEWIAFPGEIPHPLAGTVVYEGAAWDVCKEEELDVPPYIPYKVWNPPSPFAP